MKVKGLREVSIATHSLRDGIAGLEAVTGSEAFEVQEDKRPPIQARFQSIPVGQRSLALMESTDSNTAIARFLERRGPGVFSLTLEVEDVGAMADHLRQFGANVVLDQPILTSGRTGSSLYESIAINFVSPKGPLHGIVVELQQLEAPTSSSKMQEPDAADRPFSINEVHCAVLDLDVACKDLENLFGFDVGPIVEQPQPPEEVRYRNLYLGDQPILAVITPGTETSAIHRFLKRRGEGMFSISMRVGDVRAYAARVAGLGIEMLHADPKVVNGGKIGRTDLHNAQIMWVKPQESSSKVLFELQEF